MLPALAPVLLALLLALTLAGCTTTGTGEETGTGTGTGTPGTEADTYTVRMLNPDGSEVWRTEGASGSAVVWMPERTGYKFEGYFSDAGLTTPANFSGLIGEADLDLYLKWTPIRYTIRFDAGRGLGEMDELSVA